MNHKEEIFRQENLFTREDILESLKSSIEYEKSKKRHTPSPQVTKNKIKLYENFIAKIERCKLPDLTEPWWFYDYQFIGPRIKLFLCSADDFEIDEDGNSTMTMTEEEELIHVECEYLSIEKYASILGVEPSTVRQWIQHGKLKHAKKEKQTWLIPNTEERPLRGFASVQYMVNTDSQISSDEFPLLSTCESIYIMENHDNKKKYICCLDNYKRGLHFQMELTKSEVERLEYIIIESGKATVEGGVPFIP